MILVLVSLARLFRGPFLCKMVAAALRSLFHLLADFRHRCTKKTVLFLSTVLLRAGPAAVAGAYSSGKELGKRRESTGVVAGRACESCKKGTPLEPDAGSEVDVIKTVMDRLGLWVSSEEGDERDWVGGELCGGCSLVGAASGLLEEKAASLEELREAFSVFDRDGDGFITAVELGRVLQALGFGEGAGFQDCVMMIRAFDEDGDGMICLSEFKNMLQKAR